MTDPGAIDVDALFRDPSMFDSRRAWAVAGFRVLDRADNGKIMVAAHSSAPGLLFKKYVNDVDDRDQIENFERRVEGSRRLRALVADRNLRRVVVPRKWILSLPRRISRDARVLVVEAFDLLSDDQTKASYRTISSDTLTDLCTVLHHFRGMDSIAKNLPFVTDGRIAFIDTEHWDRGNKKSYLHRVGEYLTPSNRKLAKQIFRQLDGDEDGTDFDFDGEEDTSSSSSDSWSSSS